MMKRYPLLINGEWRDPVSGEWAPNLNPAPDVTSSSGTDSFGNYVDCTVSYTFKTITKYPGVPSSNPIVRTVRIYQAPQTPK